MERPSSASPPPQETLPVRAQPVRRQPTPSTVIGIGCGFVDSSGGFGGYGGQMPTRRTFSPGVTKTEKIVSARTSASASCPSSPPMATVVASGPVLGPAAVWANRTGSQPLPTTSAECWKQKPFMASSLPTTPQMESRPVSTETAPPPCNGSGASPRQGGPNTNRTIPPQPPQQQVSAESQPPPEKCFAEITPPSIRDQLEVPASPTQQRSRRSSGARKDSPRHTNCTRSQLAQQVVTELKVEMKEHIAREIGSSLNQHFHRLFKEPTGVDCSISTNEQSSLLLSSLNASQSSASALLSAMSPRSDLTSPPRSNRRNVSDGDITPPPWTASPLSFSPSPPPSKKPSGKSVAAVEAWDDTVRDLSTFAPSDSGHGNLNAPGEATLRELKVLRDENASLQLQVMRNASEAAAEAEARRRMEIHVELLEGRLATMEARLMGPNRGGASLSPQTVRRDKSNVSLCQAQHCRQQPKASGAVVSAGSARRGRSPNGTLDRSNAVASIPTRVTSTSGSPRVAPGGRRLFGSGGKGTAKTMTNTNLRRPGPGITLRR